MSTMYAENLFQELSKALTAPFLPTDKPDQAKHTLCLALTGKNQFLTRALVSRYEIKITTSLQMNKHTELFLEA